VDATGCRYTRDTQLVFFKHILKTLDKTLAAERTRLMQCVEPFEIFAESRCVIEVP